MSRADFDETDDERNHKQQATQGNSFNRLFPFLTPTIEKEGVF